MDERKLLFIDASNLFFMHYIKNPSMSTNGQQMGGVVGFMNSLKMLLEVVSPKRIFVVWEAGGSKKRRALFSDYKSHRAPPRFNRYYEDDIPDTFENRSYQIRTLTSVLNNVPICQLFVEDCEADDVIGYLCKNTFKQEKKLIASSDKDYYQLLDENTIIYSLGKKAFFGPDDVIKQFDISAENFALAKAVCGDKSDNIPGVKGVGFKTLAKRFDMVSNSVTINELCLIAEERSKISNAKIYTQIYENIDIIKRNFRLIYLDTTNLAALQIRKIDNTVESFVPIRNKMSLMRALVTEGLGSYDATGFFKSFSVIER